MTKDSMRQGRRRFVTLMGGAALGAPCLARAAVQMTNVRLVQQGNLMLHVDLSSTIGKPHLFMLANPDRLVIDLPGAVLKEGIRNLQYDDGVVAGLRFGTREGGQTTRMVVDLRRAITPSFHRVARQDGERLLIDLGVKGNPALARHAARTLEPAVLRDVIVAIDPGHGGKDPGAIGQKKTLEKDVTLQVARRLRRQLLAQRGVTPVMTREDDTYVELGERRRLARASRADLFISIHADAFTRLEARGSSVFALSLNGATSEAASWLAEQASRSARMLGEELVSEYSPELAHTLLSLTQNSTLESSLSLGDHVLEQLKQVGHVHKPQVEQAEFAVLKSPDIPSVLVETAFLSNLEEERKLNDPGFQDLLATAVRGGVLEYLARRAPQGTLIRARDMAAG